MKTKELINIINFAKENLSIPSEECIYKYYSRNDSITNKWIKKVATFYNISEENIISGKSRKKNEIKARHILYYFLRIEVLNGNIFSVNLLEKIVKKDHATIVYAYEKIQGYLTYDKTLTEEIKMISN